MTTMSPRLRKVALTAHLVVAVGWIGAVLAYLGLVGAAWISRDPRTLQAMWLGMAVIGWWVLVPLAVASLASGLVVALGTRWGLFRHYWVVFSLILTALAALVLVGHVPTVGTIAASAAGNARRAALPGELLHAGGGLLVLLLVAALNVHKPKGLTPYGQRKLRERRSQPDT